MTRSPEPGTFDVAVIGAGPAGLAAATTAAEAGATVLLIDLNERTGGQYYRHPAPEMQVHDIGRLHHAWAEFRHLDRDLRRLSISGRLRLMFRTTVWAIEPGTPFRLHTRGPDSDPRAGVVTAQSIVVATGAYDRQVPFPGWDLPGVVSGGGAQSLVKGSLVAAGSEAVVAGTGPFLLPVASSLIAAGVRVRAVVEANQPLALARHPRALLGAWSKGPEAAGYLAHLVRHRVPYLRRHRVVAAYGVDRLERVVVARVAADWTVRPGTERSVRCDLLAVGHGFLAQLDLPLQLGCDTSTGRDGGLAVRVDVDQLTSVPGVFACGETTGIGGADLALVEGRLAGAAAARTRGRPRPLSPTDLARLRRRRGRMQAFAEALHASFPLVDGWADDLTDETLVCRCEEVPYSRLREAVTSLGATDARTARLLTRTGMGWCQGRICADPTAVLCARLSGGHTRVDSSAMAYRPVAAPIPLSALAALDAADSDGR